MAVVRVREQERLFDGLLRTARDDRMLALVSGEAGVGKSHTIELLAAEAVARGFGVAVGRCFADARQRPFAPWLELLGASSNEIAGRPGEPFGSGDIRVQAFERLLAALVERAAMQPLLAVIEDLQWADADSLDLLLHVVRFGRASALFLVLTLRTNDLDTVRNARLDEVLAELARAGLETIALKPFGLEEVTAYTSALTGANAPQALARSIASLTGGNALYVRELVRHMMEEGKLRLREVGRDAAVP